VNYYNEYDPKAAAWLRELIRAGEIPAGDVDERSITEVKPNDLTHYTQCHFFAGIGGWSYALKLADWDTDRPVWTGSCPCQPFSAAGKGDGKADPRHLWPTFFGLIRECRPDTVFGEQVEGAIGHGWLDGVQTDLEGEGYAVGHCVLGAHSVGAPHIRQRLFWVADMPSPRPLPGTHAGVHSREEGAGPRDGEPERHSATSRLANPDGGQCRNGELQSCGQHGQQPQDGGSGWMEHATSDGRQQRRAEPIGRGIASGCSSSGLSGEGSSQRCKSSFWGSSSTLPCTDGKARRIEPSAFPLAHGVSGRMGLLRGYGNAIVPQVAAEFIRAYMI